MAKDQKKDIWVYAHWQGMQNPETIGLLTASHAKGKTAFAFKYDNAWLKSDKQFLLDPDIGWYSGAQFPDRKTNFGIFTDSMPDTWGRKLMQRRAAQLSENNPASAITLNDVDYLLGVHDFTRMGALRFKENPEGPFLDQDDDHPVPPWSSIRELQYSAKVFEDDKKSSDKKYLKLLLAPGSSLGGARPKVNIIDERGELWIAKFPSKNDTTDKAAWEYLAHRLAEQSGVMMSACKLEHIHGNFQTFFTKRFDRTFNERIHFSSAMTMTGKHEELIKDDTSSYLELVDFLQKSATNSKADLAQLWRRIVFNIAISNTDDHLRNHGFILIDNGWRLSPAYDLNPSIDKSGLGLNIDMDNNDLDVDLARSVGEYFYLTNRDMDNITDEVKQGTKNWRELATTLKIPRHEQELMAEAFTFDKGQRQNYFSGR